MRRFFRWYGGKIRMLEKLEALIPEHKIYLEPFVGSGALALNHIRSSVEIVNDLDGDISNLFYVMADREKGRELIERLKNVEYKREIFNIVRREQKNHFIGYNDIERANQPSGGGQQPPADDGFDPGSWGLPEAGQGGVGSGGGSGLNWTTD